MSEAESVGREGSQRACAAVRRQSSLIARRVSAGGELRNGAGGGPRPEAMWSRSPGAKVPTSINHALRGGAIAARTAGPKAPCADAAAMSRSGPGPEHRRGGAQLATSACRGSAPGAWKREGGASALKHPKRVGGSESRMVDPCGDMAPLDSPIGNGGRQFLARCAQNVFHDSARGALGSWGGVCEPE